MITRGIKIFLIRHGQDVASQMGKFEDSKLTVGGEDQAIKIAEKLTTYNLDASPISLFSSPMIRTVQTAEAIQEKLGVSLQKDSLIADRDVGQANGMTFKQIQSKFAHILTQPSFGIDFKFPDGESNGDVFNRSRKFVKEIINTSKGTQETIIVVSHPLVLNYITYLLQGGGFTDSLLFTYEPGYGALLKRDQFKFFQLVEFGAFYR